VDVDGCAVGGVFVGGESLSLFDFFVLILRWLCSATWVST
jgi:hypothetical protein